MARLDFEFHERPAHASKMGVALVLIGLAALAWAWTNLQTTRATATDLATQLAIIDQAKPRTLAKTVTPADDTARTTRQRVAAQLVFSWQPAFDALAAARSKKIALVSLDAIQDKSQLKLVGEARQLTDAIEFIEALQQQPGIRHAALTKHEVQVDDPQHPVRFDILVELGP
ncbi:MAG: PilN domain-containing protein [Polaromonas sp.]